MPTNPETDADRPARERADEWPTSGSVRRLRAPRFEPARPAAASLPLGRWKRDLQAVPDLRWERVVRARAAISARVYDDDAIIERLMDCFQEEIGILCRRRG